MNFEFLIKSYWMIIGHGRYGSNMCAHFIMRFNSESSRKLPFNVSNIPLFNLDYFMDISQNLKFQPIVPV
jgi:hypothetical protein